MPIENPLKSGGRTLRLRRTLNININLCLPNQRLDQSCDHLLHRGSSWTIFEIQSKNINATREIHKKYVAVFINQFSECWNFGIVTNSVFRVRCSLLCCVEYTACRPTLTYTCMRTERIHRSTTLRSEDGNRNRSKTSVHVRRYVQKLNISRKLRSTIRSFRFSRSTRPSNAKITTI